MAENTIGEKELKRDWPVVSGLELIDKHKGRQINLVAQGIHGVTTTYPQRKRIGL